MNKRQAKKKYNYQEKCEDIWGYVMSYSELRKMERGYHEVVIVQQNYRNVIIGSSDLEDLKELSNILGIPCADNVERKKCPYPNRLRFHKLKKNGCSRVLK